MKDESVQGLKETWDELGKEDPFGAILDPRWDEKKAEEFFETGASEIKEVMGYVESLEEKFSDVNVPRKPALDFGCGIGRLTQALAEYFEEMHGVDIASSMIEKAREYNSHGNRCIYHLNVSDDLGLFPDNRFNFI
ncbi:MAG: class I SAM-dependent methyltransferase, partial [Thermoplasmata archaeon]|nr:class I SAM-dependent methyltransferase [Thermoplasmata archaeon]